VAIVNVCGYPALRSHTMEILHGWEFGVAQPWQGKGAGLEDWRSHRVWSNEWVGLSMQCCYSFSIWWCGEAFHELGAQSAVVSALPGALPQSSVSPQLLIKVPGSQRSEGLWLCSGHHLGSSPPNISTVKKNCEALIFCAYMR
jgi:hypothetical protein